MTKLIAIFLTVISFSAIASDDKRQHVDFPQMMQEHMMSNMRDHLLALQEIVQNVSAKQFDEAAEVAEQRLGMSSLDNHGAAHMGKMMPKAMGAIGTGMHKAASRLAVNLNNAEVNGDTTKIFSGLSEVMQQCVACHAAYKIH